VCYDIADPARLRRVHRALCGYGERWQLSVFFCVLKEIDRARMESDLDELIHHTEDRVMILDLGPDEKMVRAAITVMGQPLPEPPGSIVVI
jgi:CRISPR-associated protein Cas2